MGTIGTGPVYRWCHQYDDITMSHRVNNVRFGLGFRLTLTAFWDFQGEDAGPAEYIDTRST